MAAMSLREKPTPLLNGRMKSCCRNHSFAPSQFCYAECGKRTNSSMSIGRRLGFHRTNSGDVISCIDRGGAASRFYESSRVSKVAPGKLTEFD